MSEDETFEDVFEECETCAHKDLEGGEEPCRNCFGGEHWKPKTETETEPPKAPTRSFRATRS